MNCIYLFTNYWPSIAMRAPLFFAFLIALITTALRRWGWGKHICWDCVSFSAFLKMEWGEQFLFKGGGWHEEKTEFESWNCIGSDHNIWLRIMVTHGCCKRQTVQGEIHNIQQKCNFQTHGIEEI